MTYTTTSKPRLRDNPYADWDRRKAPAESDRLCPVVVSIIGQTNEALLFNVNRLIDYDEALIGNEPEKGVHISPYDRAHLNAAKARLEKRIENGSTDTPPDYMRLFFFFARESVIFPIEQLSANIDPENKTPIFDEPYVGLPVAQEQIGQFDLQKFERLTLDTGRPVALAIIDDSIAFLHDDFIKDETPLFDSIWVQQVAGTPANRQFDNGVRIKREDIAQLVSKRDVDAYNNPINAGPFSFTVSSRKTARHRPLDHALSHGTHVASLAVSQYEANGGNLNELALFGVTLPTSVTQDTSGSTLGAYLLSAVRQAMLWADMLGEDLSEDLHEDAQVQVPLVINFSYGFSAGPKDGSSDLERILETMISSRNEAGRETKMVLPMGNSFFDRGVANWTLQPGEMVELDWVVQPDDQTSSFVEIYAKSADTSADFKLELIAPVTAQAYEIDSKTASLTDILALESDTGTIASLAFWPLHESSIWSRHAFAALAPTWSHDAEPTAPHGRWKIRITSTTEASIDVWAFVQRDDTPGTYSTIGRQSYFDHNAAWTLSQSGAQEVPSANYDAFGDGPLTHEWTQNALATIPSPHVHVVGATMTAPDGAEVRSPYGSLGHPLNPRHLPTVGALADRSYENGGVFASGTFAGTRARMNGSSVAAPQVAGELAAGINQAP